MIDDDNSGIVGRDELVGMFYKYMGDSVTDSELDRMLSIVDSDMSGEIGFSEFVIACLDPKVVLNTDNVKAIFRIFDADGSDSLSMTEIKLSICAGKNLDDRVWLAGCNSGFDEKAMANYL